MDTERAEGVARSGVYGAFPFIAAALDQAPGLRKALGTVLEKVLEVTGAGRGTIRLLDEEHQALPLFAARGFTPRFENADHRVAVGECLCGIVSGETILAERLAEETRLSRTLCRDEGVGALICVPLKAGGRVFGTLTLCHPAPRTFRLEERGLLIALGEQIGVALEQAGRYQQIRAQAIQEERALIAREIHDGVAQALAYLNVETKLLMGMVEGISGEEVVRELERIRSVIREAYEDVRELLSDFRLRVRQDRGFLSAVREYFEAFAARTGIRTTLSIESDAPFRLSPMAEGQLFRALQEALSNVRKHAGATEVRVRVRAAAGSVEIVVEDNGRGFAPEAVSGDAGRLGLGIIRERLEQVGGGLGIVSVPGEGTRLSLTAALEEAVP
jgi:two-component system nitrate/nitrite sensor histidine kinase NarX